MESDINSVELLYRIRRFGFTGLDYRLKKIH
jgi:hypothetical protein